MRWSVFVLRCGFSGNVDKTGSILTRLRMLQNFGIPPTTVGLYPIFFVRVFTLSFSK